MIDTLIKHFESSLPGRELDAHIHAFHVNPDVLRVGRSKARPMQDIIDGLRGFADDRFLSGLAVETNAPHYSTITDDAITLIQKGVHWGVFYTPGCSEWTYTAALGIGEFAIEIGGSNPAIALCRGWALHLKARGELDK